MRSTILNCADPFRTKASLNPHTNTLEKPYTQQPAPHLKYFPKIFAH